MEFHDGVWPLVHSNRSTISLSEGSTGKDPGVLGDKLLEDVVLQGSLELVDGDTLLLGRGNEEAEDDRGRTIDRHRDRDLIERNTVEQRLHVGQRGNGDAALADFTLGTRMIRIVPHQRGEIERDRQAGLPALEQELVPSIGVRRPFRSRRTAASSRVAHGTSWDECPACTGSLPAAARVRRHRAACRPIRPTRPEMVVKSESRRAGSAATFAFQATISSRNRSISASRKASRSSRTSRDAVVVISGLLPSARPQPPPPPRRG